jgi:hypothetical protein
MLIMPHKINKKDGFKQYVISIQLSSQQLKNIEKDNRLKSIGLQKRIVEIIDLKYN